jgi:hypothetical protein
LKLFEEEHMRRLVLGSLLSFACFACAQQQPVGDIYESGSGSAESPAQAVQKLYELAATMTNDPSSGYNAKTSSWPEADAAWAQWGNAIGLNGNALTQQQRSVLVPCAANLGAAIDSAERSYRIQISQVGNAPAQADAQQLKATARKEFELCNPADAMNGSNGTPATAGGSGAPLQGGASTGSNGTPGSGAPGAPSGSPLLKTGTSFTEPGPGSQGTGTPGSGMPRSGTPGTILDSGPGTPPSNSGTNPPTKAPGTGGPSKGGSGQPPTETNGTPDPNNRTLGIMIGMSNCIKSLPNLLSGLGSFMQGKFVDAATAWGIDPKLGGPTILQKELSVPVIGNNGKSLVPNNLTPYQQGVIDGQRLCGYTLSGLAGKGLGAAGKSVAGKVAPLLKGGAQATGPKPVGGPLTPGEGTPATGTPGEPGAPGGNGAEPAQPVPGEPNGAPPTDKTPITNPDKTVVTNPAPSSSQPTIKGGVSAQDPIAGNDLDSGLSNDVNNDSPAPELANKFVELADGPVKLGNFIGQGTFAAVFQDGATMVTKVAKRNGLGYFNKQLQGQLNGSQALQKAGIDHPEVTPKTFPSDIPTDVPESIEQESAAQKYPGSQELSATSFQKASAAMQKQILDSLKSVLLDKLPRAGYVMGDINPSNFTMWEDAGVLQAIPHDTDMIMTLPEIDQAFANQTKGVPSVLDGSLGASGARAYVPGSYPNAQALANQLFIGLEDWLYNGPKAFPMQ